MNNSVYYPLGNIYPCGKLPYRFLHDDETTTKEIFLYNLLLIITSLINKKIEI
jgi:hypothetical protein